MQQAVVESSCWHLGGRPHRCYSRVGSRLLAVLHAKKAGEKGTKPLNTCFRDSLTDESTAPITYLVMGESLPSSQFFNDLGERDIEKMGRREEFQRKRFGRTIA